jgi:hypothetical protein
MSDAFNFDPFLTGSAGGFMGNVGGYNIGAQPEPTFTTPAAPAQSFTPTETGYTPTFDFSSFLGALPDYGMPAANYQAPQINFFNPADYPPAFNAEPAAAKVKPGQQGFQIPGTTTIDPTSGMLRSVSPAEVGGTVISPEQAAPAQQDTGGFFQNLLGKGFSTSDALKLALGLGGGIMGMNAQKKAADEAAAAEAEYKAAAEKAAGQYSGLAQPYLTAGGSQLSMALQGSLAPAQMQQFQAAQAQLAQGAERTGGVGAIQSTAALQNIYQQALQNQQNMAIQLLGPGNTLASNAIATELQGTQGGLKLGLDLATQANAASQNMYSAIASMIGGSKLSPTGATAS